MAKKNKKYMVLKERIRQLMTPQRVIVWLFLIWETSFEKNIYFASSSKRYIGFDQQKSGYVR